MDHFDSFPFYFSTFEEKYSIVMDYIRNLLTQFSLAIVSKITKDKHNDKYVKIEILEYPF